MARLRSMSSAAKRKTLNENYPSSSSMLSPNGGP